MRLVVNVILHYHPYKDENDDHINETNHCLLVTSQMRLVVNVILHYHPYKDENDYHINETNNCFLVTSQMGQVKS